MPSSPAATTLFFDDFAHMPENSLALWRGLGLAGSLALAQYPGYGHAPRQVAGVTRAITYALEVSKETEAGLIVGRGLGCGCALLAAVSS